MNITRAQLSVIIITLLFAALSVGFFVGRSAVSAPVSVSVASAEQSAAALDSAGPDTVSDAPVSASALPSPSAGAPVNINTAGEDELCTLPGVGPSTAARIITHRTEHGAFAQIEEIMDVYGIGEKTFENIRNLITID